VLTLTDHAQDAVRALTPQAPESAGLRIAPANQGFELSLVTEPMPGDALIDDGGVRVFVEPQTAQLLDEQTLDAQLEGGEVNFFLASPDAMPAPGGDDDETQARHVASRAELLPEERAAGSDDPQAQAKVILEESEEHTEHPDLDAARRRGASRRARTEQAPRPFGSGSYRSMFTNRHPPTTALTPPQGGEMDRQPWGHSVGAITRPDQRNPTNRKADS
jgi:iron-sulfur cluster assembly protein